ncbi:MAG: ribosome silencing factor [Bacteroidales bacterium]|nr:ribosome silencing factor [Bacteroidales bacterium]
MSKIKELTADIIEAIQDKKGKKISVIDLSGIDGAPAPEFIVCQGNSTSQVSAIADNIIEELSKRRKVKPEHTDGYRNSQWIIVDYGSVMVHIFLPETREFYRLEELWTDAPTREIEDLD